MSAPRVILVSGHYLHSRRRAGFHHLAQAYSELGWEVVFVTVGLSPLSYAAGDHRAGEVPLRAMNRLRWRERGLASYVWATPFHPAQLRRPALNRLSAPLFRTYGRLPFPLERQVVSPADLIVFESTSGLFLVDRWRRGAPSARLVYRQSDDLGAVGAHPVVGEAERRALPHFHLVSVPSGDRLERFRGLGTVVVQPHGIDEARFGRPHPSPYPPGGRHAVFVGVDGLDWDWVRRASAMFPEWTFDLIGPWAADGLPPNVVLHGEMPFARTVPYLQHADVGLHTIARPLPHTFRESLKVVQLTHLGKPIVAERAAAARWPNVFAYDRGDDESIRRSFVQAAAMSPDAVDRSGIRSWTGLARELAGGRGPVADAA